VQQIELVRHGCRPVGWAAFCPGHGHQRRQGCRRAEP